MSPHTLKRLSAVHPELKRRVEILLRQLAAQGLTVEVVQGFRAPGEQDALYAQGRTKPGKKVTNAKRWQSNHNYGLAVDLCPFVDGRPNWDAPFATWQQIGRTAEGLGLEWGGRWAKFRDLPHVQMPGLSVAQCYALHRKGGLPLVWERASRALSIVEADFSPELPQNAPEAKKATPIPVRAGKSSLPGKAPQIGASDFQLHPPNLTPNRFPASDVTRPATVGQAVKTGNTLPSFLALLVAVRDFLAANKWIVIAVIVSILIVVAWIEFGPRRKTR